MTTPRDPPRDRLMVRIEVDEETRRLLALPPHERVKAITRRRQAEIYVMLRGIIDRGSLAELLEPLMPAYSALVHDAPDPQMITLLRQAADFAKAHDL